MRALSAVILSVIFSQSIFLVCVATAIGGKKVKYGQPQR